MNVEPVYMIVYTTEEGGRYQMAGAFVEAKARQLYEQAKQTGSLVCEESGWTTPVAAIWLVQVIDGHDRILAQRGINSQRSPAPKERWIDPRWVEQLIEGANRQVAELAGSVNHAAS